MSLNEQQVRKIAKLARIKLTDSEVEKFKTEISGILNWVDMLQEVDTSNVPQMYSPLQQSLPLRKDEVTDGNKQKDIVANATGSKYGCFTVPKVVE